MGKGKVLVIGSNATRIEVQGGSWGACGNYLNETVVPMMAVIDAGYDVVLATPSGTQPHIDEASDSPRHFGGDQAAYARAKAFWANDPAVNQVRALRSVIEEGLDNYAGVFVPGGQAPVVDLMQDREVGEILRHFHDRGKPTALLCHGPIAVASAMPHAREFRAALIAGEVEKAKEWAKRWQYAGYKMTVFSNTGGVGRGPDPAREALFQHGRRVASRRRRCDHHRARFRAALDRGSRTHHRPEPAVRSSRRGKACPGPATCRSGQVSQVNLAG
jgi:putative intracellular protease/amidase